MHEDTKNSCILEGAGATYKKVVSNILGLVDFAIGLVNSVLNLPEGQVEVVGEFKLQKNCNQCC